MRSMPSMPRSEGSSVSQTSSAIAFAGFDFCFGAQDDDDVGRVQDLVGDGLGVFAGDVDAEFSQGLHGLGVEGRCRV